MVAICWHVNRKNILWEIFYVQQKEAWHQLCVLKISQTAAQDVKNVQHCRFGKDCGRLSMNIQIAIHWQI